MTTKIEIDSSLFMRDFIYREILKRHIEEYHPDIFEEIISLLKKANIIKNFDKIILNPVNAIVYGYVIHRMYISYKNIINDKDDKDNLPTIESLNKQFHFDKIIKIYDRLYEIVKNYDEDPIGILFIKEIESFIDHYIKKYNIYFDNDDDDNSLFKINKKEVTEDDSNMMTIRLIFDKMDNESDIYSHQIETINYFLKNKNIENIKTSSFERYLFGLYAWDLMKKTGNYNNAYKKYKEFKKNIKDKRPNINENTVRCEDKKCKLDGCLKDDFNCDGNENCMDYVRRGYKIITLCIRDKKIYNTWMKGSKIDPKPNANIIRIPFEFFSEAHKYHNVIKLPKFFSRYEIINYIRR